MIVVFEKEYLRDLYVTGKATNRKYWLQPQITAKYVKVIDLMKQQENMLGLMKFGSLRYEKLHGDKEGRSSVRINNKYRIEFTEEVQPGETIATICNITELSNHYQ